MDRVFVRARSWAINAAAPFRRGFFGSGPRGAVSATSALLASWGCDEATVNAGLCHSIYGTASHGAPQSHSCRSPCISP